MDLWKNDEYCQAVLQHHFPEVPILGDIKNVTKETVPTRPDVICGGFPCQPFSVAGDQRAKDDPRHLWPEMLRIIKEQKPTWVVGENVSGLVKLGLDEILDEMEDQGYSTRTFNIPAFSVGAPHQRQRLWIIGHLGDPEHNGSPAEQKLRSCSTASKHNSEGQKPTKQLEGAGRSPNGESIFRCKAVARADEEQQEWEEPRVVGDSEGTRLKSLSSRQTEVEPRGTGTRYARPFFDEVEAQSKLGGTVDGSTCRVDALRLLGNGVVPATCAKAFVTLFNRLNG